MRCLLLVLAFALTAQAQSFSTLGQMWQGRGPKWTPLTADGSLEAWWAADDASTFTLQTNTVMEWRDKSGNNRHLVPNTANASPNPDRITENGFYAVNFESPRRNLIVSNNLDWVSFAHKGERTLIAWAARAGSVSSPNAFRALMGTGGAGSLKHGFAIAYADRNAQSENDGLYYGVGRGVAGQFTIEIRTNDVWTPNTRMWGVIDSKLTNATGSVTAYIDDWSASFNRLNAPSTANQATADFALGHSERSTVGASLDGVVHEVFIIRNPSDNDVLKAQDYLKERWDL